MTIVSAEILGVRTGQVNGNYGSAAQYTVLIQRDDGSPEIRECSLQDLRQLAPWLRTPMSGLKALTERVTALEEAVRRMTWQNIAAAHPMPEVVGLPGDEAVERLTADGFRTILLHESSGGAPAGKVYAAVRREDDPMAVELDVRCPLPEVVGLPEEEALTLAREAGFRVKTEAALTEEDRTGEVVSVSRPDPYGMDVTFSVARRVPELKEKSLDAALHELESLGIPVAGIRRKNEPGVPLNSVLDWHRAGGSALTLVVASDKPNEVYTCSQVKISHQMMQDCEVDSITGSATFQYEKRDLEVELTTVIRPAHSHSWVAVAEIWIDQVKMNNFATLHDVAGVTSGVPQKLRLTYTLDRGLKTELPPARVTLRLFTEFGDIQKYNAALSVDLDFDWE